MDTDLQPRLNRIKDALREAIALSEAATPGPWLRDPGNDVRMQVIAHYNEVIVYHHQHNRQKDSRVVPNHDFIAHARTLLPATAKALLTAIEAMEVILRDTEEHRIAYEQADEALTEIANSWPE